MSGERSPAAQSFVDAAGRACAPKEVVMLRTLFALPAGPAVVGNDRATEFAVRPTALSCVWIETGNLRQPLARIWIDRDMRMAEAGSENATEIDPDRLSVFNVI
jgi:hypothetical protein